MPILMQYIEASLVQTCQMAEQTEVNNDGGKRQMRLMNGGEDKQNVLEKRGDE